MPTDASILRNVRSALDLKPLIGFLDVPRACRGVETVQLDDLGRGQRRQRCNRRRGHPTPTRLRATSRRQQTTRVRF